VLDIALNSINLDSCLGVIDFEELDLDNGLRVEAFNFITLLCSINLVRFNRQSDVLWLGFFRIIAIHDIIGFIVLFIDFPLLSKVIVSDILLDVIIYGSWLDSISININAQDVVESLLNKASLPDQV